MTVFAITNKPKDTDTKAINAQTTLINRFSALITRLRPYSVVEDANFLLIFLTSFSLLFSETLNGIFEFL